MRTIWGTFTILSVAVVVFGSIATFHIPQLGSHARPSRQLMPDEMYKLGAIDAMRGDCDLSHELTPMGRDILDNADPHYPVVTRVRRETYKVFRTEERCRKLFKEFPELFYPVRFD